MKRFGIFMIPIFAILVMLSCTDAQKPSEEPINEDTITRTAPDTTSTANVQLIYFHATNRCVTCNAVEDQAKKLLTEQYKTQLDNGTIAFGSYNLQEEENTNLVQKYQITFSTLLLISKKNGADSVNNLTDMAFQYAKNQPDKYKELLKIELDKNL